MLSTFVQFCTQWLGTDSQWPIVILVLVIILIITAPCKIVTIKKNDENKWTIFLR